MKQRIIYNNYYLDDLYEAARENLLYDNEEEDISDDAVLDEVYTLSQLEWEDAHEELKSFFKGGSWLLRDSVGRWDGAYGAGYVFYDFDDMFYKAADSCAYIKIWEERGHLYLKCSHHDGTNLFEIKKINDKAERFIDSWAYSLGDTRTEEEIHNIVWNSNFLSSLPHYARKVYGCA